MNQASSPLLPINSRPMSPSMASNLHSTNNLMPSDSHVRYSPLSPHYQTNSPNRGYSPGGSSRHYNGMSPNYSYNSQSSPHYSPNSSGNPILSQALLLFPSRTPGLLSILRTALMVVSGRPTTLKVPSITSLPSW